MKVLLHRVEYTAVQYPFLSYLRSKSIPHSIFNFNDPLKLTMSLLLRDQPGSFLSAFVFPDKDRDQPREAFHTEKCDCHLRSSETQRQVLRWEKQTVVGPHQLEVSDVNGWKVSRKELNCGIGSETVFGICWWLCVGAGAINREVFDRVMTSLAWLLQWQWLSFHNGFCFLASLAEYYNISGLEFSFCMWSDHCMYTNMLSLFVPLLLWLFLSGEAE